MRILINLENTDDIREIYIDVHETLETLKYLIEAEFNIPFSQQILKYDNKMIFNFGSPISSTDIKEDEIVVVAKKQIMNDVSKTNLGSGLGNFTMSKIFDDTMKKIKTNAVPQNTNTNINNSNLFNFPNFQNIHNNNYLENRIKNESQKLKEYYLNNPDELNYLFNTDPELAEVLVSNDEQRLEENVRTKIIKMDEIKKKEKDDHFKLMNADPNDPQAQKKIEEMIRLKNIQENYIMAQEYLPETFSQVHMLFINIEINKNKVVALVDTGAQTTIICESLAKKCGVFNLCDTRFSGIAKGVGTSKILGVIHAAQMKIGEK